MKISLDMDTLTTDLIERAYPLSPCLMTDSIGIADGKAAALIFLSLRSELCGDEADREKAQLLFTEIMETLADGSRTPDITFMTGDPGAVRGVTFLTELGLIETDHTIDRILRNALERRNFINTIPAIPMPDPDIYGEAIAFLSLFREDDESLWRYSLQEYLISLTDNCLRLLTEAVPTLYDPADMKPSFRHSILRFALGIMEKGIFPSKAERIVSAIKDYVHHDHGSQEACIHSAITRSLLGDRDAVGEYMRKVAPEAALADLSQLALFSMAYACPRLLAEGVAAAGEKTLAKIIDSGYVTATTPMSAVTTASGLMYLKLTRQTQ